MITNLSVTSKQIAEKFGWFVEVSQWNYAKINTRTNLSIYLQFVGKDISIVGGIQTESCLSKFELKVPKETDAVYIANQLASQQLVQEIGAKMRCQNTQAYIITTVMHYPELGKQETKTIVAEIKFPHLGDRIPSLTTQLSHLLAHQFTNDSGIPIELRVRLHNPIASSEYSS